MVGEHEVVRDQRRARVPVPRRGRGPEVAAAADHVLVFRTLAGEVPVVEIGERVVQRVGVVETAAADQPLLVELGEGERLRLVAAGGADHACRQGQSITADRDRFVGHTHVALCAHRRVHLFEAPSILVRHRDDRPTILEHEVRCRRRGQRDDGGDVTAAQKSVERGHEIVLRSQRGVVEHRCRCGRTQLCEPGERFVVVVLVEPFASVHQARGVDGAGLRRRRRGRLRRGLLADGRNACRLCGRLGKTELLRRDGRALGLVQPERIGARGSRARRVARAVAQVREHHTRIGVVEDEVGRGRDLDRLLRERDRRREIAPGREHRGLAPCARRCAVLRFWPASSSLAAAMRSASSTSPRSSSAVASSAAAWPASAPTPSVPRPSYAARSGAIAAAGSPAMSSTMPVKRSVSSRPWRRPSSSSDARADASIERDTSKRPRSASSTAWQRIDVASTDGDAVVMRRRRTTSRQRPPARATGLGPNSAACGAAPSTAVTRRRSSAARAAPSARSSTASASPTRPSRASRPARTWCALASPAPSPSACSVSAAPVAARRRRRSPSGSVSPTSWASKHAAQAPSCGRRRPSLRQLLHQRRAADDVARREEALARHRAAARTAMSVSDAGSTASARRGRAHRPTRGRRGRVRAGPRSRSSSRGAAAEPVGRRRRRCRARCGTGAPARSGTRSRPRARR